MYGFVRRHIVIYQCPNKRYIKNIIKDLLLNDENLHNKTSIPPEEFLEITEFVLTKTWFIFNNDILTQTDAVAMGGPASSVVAEIYMQAHRQTALTTFSNKPKVWERCGRCIFNHKAMSFR